ncbi:MAG: hypothetical protein PHP42_14230 [Bacteroidota bacterium]|nr:hypothetical protein [Bacteroidota bacterium]
MGFGQTMLTIAFLVILTIAVMNANRIIVDKEESYYESQAYEQASILANSLLSEIIKKKFDSQVDTNSTTYQVPGDFDYWMGPSYTAQNNVNPSGNPDVFPYKSIRGDNGNWFDDVDDYNGYKRSASTASMTGFTLTVSVYYVKQSNPNTSAPSQTYLKKIDVTVSNPKYLKNNLVFSTVAAYTF